jgi:hypothetical protein
MTCKIQEYIYFLESQVFLLRIMAILMHGTQKDKLVKRKEKEIALQISTNFRNIKHILFKKDSRRGCRIEKYAESY